jgi:hypothetical protein
MSIPKGILATDKWFEIINYAGNSMDTTSTFNASASINKVDMGKITYSDNLINISSKYGNNKTCTRAECVSYNDSSHFSIIDIFNHLFIRMDYFTSELYALSNCVTNCNLTPANNPTSCIVDSQSLSSIQYCNKNLYGTNAATSVATNQFMPYMNSTTRKINLTNLPTYKKTELTTISITKNGSTATYKIHPNQYFDLNLQYVYITNLINTLNTLLVKYLVNNSKSSAILQQNYTDLVNRRRDMDAKLEELFGKNNTIHNQYSQYYDSTIYTSIFWTVLVTSLLFYTFRKL